MTFAGTPTEDDLRRLEERRDGHGELERHDDSFHAQRLGIHDDVPHILAVDAAFERRYGSIGSR